MVDEFVDGAAATADEVDALLARRAAAGSPRRAPLSTATAAPRQPVYALAGARRAADARRLAAAAFGLSGGGGGLGSFRGPCVVSVSF